MIFMAANAYFHVSVPRQASEYLSWLGNGKHGRTSLQNELRPFRPLFSERQFLGFSLFRGYPIPTNQSDKNPFCFFFGKKSVSFGSGFESSP
jgi:hypothetical protein